MTCYEWWWWSCPPPPRENCPEKARSTTSERAGWMWTAASDVRDGPRSRGHRDDDLLDQVRRPGADDVTALDVAVQIDEDLHEPLGVHRAPAGRLVVRVGAGGVLSVRLPDPCARAPTPATSGEANTANGIAL